MWSRVVEVMLGCWLAVSPFVFAHQPNETAFWINDFACATAVITLALLSYWPPTKYAHLLIAAVGVWMIVFGYLHFGGPIPPAAQNSALTGLMLIMFAVIPNWASTPPAGWRKYAAAGEQADEIAEQRRQSKQDYAVGQRSAAR